MFSPFSCYVPLVTPFNSQGEIDYSSYKRLIEWHEDQGTRGLVLFGTTGESATLSEEEKIEILEFAIECVPKGMVVIANTGCASTASTKRLSAVAAELGADALLVIVPYYTKPSERGCIAHFKEVDACNIPFIAYHHPGRTGVKLSFDAISQILCMENCIGIKECSSDIQLIKKIAETFPDTLIFSGNDGQIIQELRAGANGSIAAIGNLIPKAWQSILNLSQLDMYKALEVFERYKYLIDCLFKESNPQGIKYALSEMGMIENRLRLPMLSVPLEDEELIYNEMKLIGSIELPSSKSGIVS